MQPMPVTSAATPANQGAEIRARLCFPDALRGIAALWVFLYHLSEGRHVEALKAVLPGWVVTSVFDAGHLGVPVFFVLSGYVMALTTARAGLTPAGAGQFLAKRLLRISPPYYFAILVVCAFLLLKQHEIGTPTDWPTGPSLLLHLAYLQGLFGVAQINVVFWTLCIEMQFYVVFSLLAVGLHLVRLDARETTWAWLIVAVGALYWPLFRGHEPKDVVFFQSWYAFLSGLLVCRFASARTFQVKACIVAYLLSTLAIGIAFDETFARTSGVVALSLVLAVHLGGMTRWLHWELLQRLGLISYSFYLLHNPVTGAVTSVGHRYLGDSPVADLVVAGAAFVAVVAAAALAYRYVEMPAIALARSVSRPVLPRRNDVPRPG